MLGFTESLRTELLHDQSKVHVTMVHLPALNTPQFEWVKSRLLNKPQPVPPIFQPEVAAKSRLLGCTPKRDARSTSEAQRQRRFVGEKLAPGLLDHYLRKTA